MSYDEVKTLVLNHVTPRLGEVRFNGNRRMEVIGICGDWVDIKDDGDFPLTCYQVSMGEWCFGDDFATALRAYRLS